MTRLALPIDQATTSISTAEMAFAAAVAELRLVISLREQRVLAQLEGVTSEPVVDGATVDRHIELALLSARIARNLIIAAAKVIETNDSYAMLAEASADVADDVRTIPGGRSPAESRVAKP